MSDVVIKDEPIDFDCSPVFLLAGLADQEIKEEHDGTVKTEITVGEEYDEDCAVLEPRPAPHNTPNAQQQEGKDARPIGNAVPDDAGNLAMKMELPAKYKTLFDGVKAFPEMTKEILPIIEELVHFHNCICLLRTDMNLFRCSDCGRGFTNYKRMRLHARFCVVLKLENKFTGVVPAPIKITRRSGPKSKVGKENQDQCNDPVTIKRKPGPKSKKEKAEIARADKSSTDVDDSGVAENAADVENIEPIFAVDGVEEKGEEDPDYTPGKGSQGKKRTSLNFRVTADPVSGEISIHKHPQQAIKNKKSPRTRRRKEDKEFAKGTCWGEVTKTPSCRVLKVVELNQFTHKKINPYHLFRSSGEMLYHNPVPLPINFNPTAQNVFDTMISSIVGVGRLVPISQSRRQYGQHIVKLKRPLHPDLEHLPSTSSAPTDAELSVAPRDPLFKKLKIKCSRNPEPDELQSQPIISNAGNIGSRRTKMPGQLGPVKKKAKRGMMYKILGEDTSAGTCGKITFKKFKPSPTTESFAFDADDGCGINEKYSDLELRYIVHWLLNDPIYLERSAVTPAHCSILEDFVNLGNMQPNHDRVRQILTQIDFPDLEFISRFRKVAVEWGPIEVMACLRLFMKKQNRRTSCKTLSKEAFEHLVSYISFQFGMEVSDVSKSCLNTMLQANHTSFWTTGAQPVGLGGQRKRITQYSFAEVKVIVGWLVGDCDYRKKYQIKSYSVQNMLENCRQPSKCHEVRRVLTQIGFPNRKFLSQFGYKPSTWCRDKILACLRCFMDDPDRQVLSKDDILFCHNFFRKCKIEPLFDSQASIYVPHDSNVRLTSIVERLLKENNSLLWVSLHKDGNNITSQDLQNTAAELKVIAGWLFKEVDYESKYGMPIGSKQMLERLVKQDDVEKVQAILSALDFPSWRFFSQFCDVPRDWETHEIMASLKYFVGHANSKSLYRLSQSEVDFLYDAFHTTDERVFSRVNTDISIYARNAKYMTATKILKSMILVNLQSSKCTDNMEMLTHPNNCSVGSTTFMSENNLGNQLLFKGTKRVGDLKGCLVRLLKEANFEQKYGLSPDVVRFMQRFVYSEEHEMVDIILAKKIMDGIFANTLLDFMPVATASSLENVSTSVQRTKAEELKENFVSLMSEYYTSNSKYNVSYNTLVFIKQFISDKIPASSYVDSIQRADGILDNIKLVVSNNTDNSSGKSGSSYKPETSSGKDEESSKVAEAATKQNQKISYNDLTPDELTYITTTKNSSTVIAMATATDSQAAKLRAKLRAIINEEECKTRYKLSSSVMQFLEKFVNNTNFAFSSRSAFENAKHILNDIMHVKVALARTKQHDVVGTMNEIIEIVDDGHEPTERVTKTSLGSDVSKDSPPSKKDEKQDVNNNDKSCSSDDKVAVTDKHRLSLRSCSEEELPRMDETSQLFSPSLDLPSRSSSPSLDAASRSSSTSLDRSTPSKLFSPTLDITSKSSTPSLDITGNSSSTSLEKTSKSPSPSLSGAWTGNFSDSPGLKVSKSLSLSVDTPSSIVDSFTFSVDSFSVDTPSFSVDSFSLDTPSTKVDSSPVVDKKPGKDTVKVMMLYPNSSNTGINMLRTKTSEVRLKNKVTSPYNSFAFEAAEDKTGSCDYAGSSSSREAVLACSQQRLYFVNGLISKHAFGPCVSLCSRHIAKISCFAKSGLATKRFYLSNQNKLVQFALKQLNDFKRTHQSVGSQTTEDSDLLKDVWHAEMIENEKVRKVMIDENHHIKTQVEQRREQEHKLKGRISDLEQQLSTEKELRKFLKEESDKLVEANKNLSAASVSCDRDTELTVLREEVKALQDEKLALKLALKSISKQTGSDTVRGAEQSSAVRCELRELKSCTGELRGQVAELESENGELRNTVKSKTKKIKSLDVSIQSISEALRHQTKTISTLSRKHSSELLEEDHNHRIFIGYESLVDITCKVLGSQQIADGAKIEDPAKMRQVCASVAGDENLFALFMKVFCANSVCADEAETSAIEKRVLFLINLMSYFYNGERSEEGEPSSSNLSELL